MINRPGLLRGFQDDNTFAKEGSGQEWVTIDRSEEATAQKHDKLKRRGSYEFAGILKRSRSQSLSPDWDPEIGAYIPPIADDPGSELPNNSADSASEVDWESFLCEDEMLPASNWEEEFPKYKARMMDHYGYKGIIEDEEQHRLKECEDEPWNRYNPENFMDAEMEGITVTNQLEDQIKICYGMVSIF